MTERADRFGFPDGTDAGLPTVTILAHRSKSGGEEVAVSVELSAGGERDHRILTVRQADFDRLGLGNGPIDPETYDELEHLAAVLGAMHCGARLLVYSPNTRRALIRKIMRHGYSREEAEEGADRLEEAGLIDEDGYLEAEIDRCLRKLWGEARIREKLYTCGFGSDAMRRVPELLAEVDFAANCRALIEKQFGGLPDGDEEMRKLLSVLRRYGYRRDDIYVALREMRLDEAHR